MLKEIIFFLVGAILSLSFAHPVDTINIAIPAIQGQNQNQNPIKEILVPAQTMFRKGNWKNKVGLGNYGTGYTGGVGLGNYGTGFNGGYPGYGGYTGYNGQATGYTGGFAGGYQPGSYGWRTG